MEREEARKATSELNDGLGPEPEPKVRAGWEMFSNPSYYDMWAVREVGDRSFESPRLFHFVFKEDAEAFKALLEKSYHAIRA